MCALARFCPIGDARPTRLFTGERYIYVTTTILDAWGWERAGCPGSPLDHAVLFRVARPGGTHLCLRRTLSPTSQKHERIGSDAPNWGRCAHRDRLFRLSLSSDHYPAGAYLTPGRNGPGQFSQPQYRPGLHRGGHLPRSSACVGGLVLVRPETWKA